MTNMTFPSRIHIADIPEVKNFKAEFVYNFFEADERVESEPLDRQNARTSESLRLLGRTPRYVKLSFAPTALQDRANIGDVSWSKNLFIKKNVEKIQSELSFSNYNFAVINVQDENLSGKLFKTVSGSMVFRGISEGSLTENAKDLNDLTSDDVSGEELIQMVNSLSLVGVDFVDQNKQKVNRKDKLAKLRSLIVNTQANNKVIGSLANSVAADQYSLYAPEFAAILSDANNLQKITRGAGSSTSLNALDYDTGFLAIKTEHSHEDASASSSAVIVGYIVDRYEYVGRKIVQKEPILVTGQNASSTYDADVKYGRTYAYSVRTVAAVRFPDVDNNDNNIWIIGLVSSRSSSKIVVKCIEDSPPAHPADFKPNWDHKNNQLRLIWSFPVTTQRDIKYFQIFRRKTIDEPFELLQEYDFNDSVIKTRRSEIIPKKYVKKMVDSPSTVYIDSGFTKDSSYIYALMSIDAHGTSSNYSEQFCVSFDRFKNKLVVSRVSQSGAPKSLPNFYLPAGAFVDTMKTSGFDRMTVYFDPEYLSLTDDDGIDLDLLPINDASAAYKIQVINTDVQKSNIVTILLNNLRT
jgi:hypothetical protein